MTRLHCLASVDIGHLAHIAETKGTVGCTRAHTAAHAGSGSTFTAQNVAGQKDV